MVFIQGGLDDNKDEVCVSTPQGDQNLNQNPPVPWCISLLVTDGVCVCAALLTH